MMLAQTYIILIALVTSWACCLPGAFLVVQGNALVSDAISHSILLGIVLSFLYTKTLYSPLLFIGAVAMSILTALLTEKLKKLKFVSQDAAIGLLFPFFFAFAVMLITLFASHVHIDTDAVLLGELALTPFEQISINGVQYGPCALWLMGCIFLINAACLYIFKKEFIFASFDPLQAQLTKYQPNLFNYALMVLASISIIGAFQTAGTILVVSFIIVPTACARLLSNSINQIFIISLLICTVAVLAGYLLAHFCNSTIAGSIALVNGLLFTLIFLFNKIFLTAG